MGEDSRRLSPPQCAERDRREGRQTEQHLNPLGARTGRGADPQEDAGRNWDPEMHESGAMDGHGE